MFYVMQLNAILVLLPRFCYLQQQILYKNLFHYTIYHYIYADSEHAQFSMVTAPVCVNGLALLYCVWVDRRLRLTD